jgi:hypothetical protein
MSWSRVAIIASICLGLTTAVAQQREAITAACSASNRGTVNCPTYTAPATTAVPRASIDGSMTVPSQTSTTLFKGAVPPNGFMLQVVQNAGVCVVNDNGPASGAGFMTSGGGLAGFQFNTEGVGPFVTPPGYRPLGPVSVWCTTPVYVAARGW